MEGLNLSKFVTTKQQYFWRSLVKQILILEKNIPKSVKLKIVAIDFGIKKSILNRLVSHGCEILVLPSQSSLEEVLSNNPDGIFFSNGTSRPLFCF